MRSTKAAATVNPASALLAALAAAGIDVAALAAGTEEAAAPKKAAGKKAAAGKAADAPRDFTIKQPNAAPTNSQLYRINRAAALAGLTAYKQPTNRGDAGSLIGKLPERENTSAAAKATIKKLLA